MNTEAHQSTHNGDEAQQAYERMRDSAEMHRKRQDAIKREKAIEFCGIGKRFAGMTFADYRADTEQQIHALEACKRFAGNFTRVLELGSNIVMLGTTGTGKTMLAACTLMDVIRAGYTGRYHTVQTLIREIRSSWDKESKSSERETLAQLAGYDLLVVDEVGVQYGTDAEKVALFELINARYEAMKPTIVISNLTLKTQDGAHGVTIHDALGDRVVDRLRQNSAVIPFAWSSWRGKK